MAVEVVGDAGADQRSAGRIVHRPRLEVVDDPLPFRPGARLDRAEEPILIALDALHDLVLHGFVGRRIGELVEGTGKARPRRRDLGLERRDVGRIVIGHRSCSLRLAPRTSGRAAAPPALRRRHPTDIQARTRRRSWRAARACMKSARAHARLAAVGRCLEEAREPEARDQRTGEHRRRTRLGEAAGLVHQLVDAAVLQRRREAVDAGGDAADIAAGRRQRPLDLGGDAVGEFRRRVDLLGRLALLVVGERPRLLLGARGETRRRPARRLLRLVGELRRGRFHPLDEIGGLRRGLRGGPAGLLAISHGLKLS